MASIVIAGDTSGSVTLASPAVAGTTTLTLPATSATLATLTTPSFATTIGVGGATASGSGSGITFPSTQSASTNANTLDDYDEYTSSSTACSGAITTSVAWRLVKVGNVVTLEMPKVTGTFVAGAGIQYGANIPSKYRVPTNHMFTHDARTGGAEDNPMGRTLIETDGTITLYRYNGGGNYSGDCGMQYSSSVSWTL